MSVTVLLLSYITAIAAVAGPQSPAASGDESAVRDVIRQYVEARERADAAAVRALFTEDADQLTSSGDWRRGRDAVVTGSLASSASNSGKRTITLETIRFAVPDVALADGAYTIAGAAGTRSMRASFVLIRQGGAWRITAIRNMLPAPAP